MRWLMAVVIAAFVVSTTKADDDIKDYVEFQNIKLRTYDDAVAEHSKTNCTVIVWVASNDDQIYDAWKQTKTLGYHVFVKIFLHTKAGIVVGGDRNGQFSVLSVVKYSTTDEMVTSIKSAIGVKTPPKRLTPIVDCPDGKCPQSQPFNFRYRKS